MKAAPFGLFPHLLVDWLTEKSDAPFFNGCTRNFNLLYD
jgi:hypothetical protein